MNPAYLLALLLLPATAHAAAPIQNGGNLGLGLGAGTGVTGLSVKYFIGADFALQGVLGPWNALDLDPLSSGINSSSSGSFAVSLDFILESQPVINGTFMDVAFNWGGGLAIVPDSGPLAGAAGIGGLELNFEAIPIDVVFEYRPHVWFYPDVDFDWVGFTGHIRVYPFPAGPK